MAKTKDIGDREETKRRCGSWRGIHSTGTSLLERGAGVFGGGVSIADEKFPCWASSGDKLPFWQKTSIEVLLGLIKV